jgi:hypothetical protein
MASIQQLGEIFPLLAASVESVDDDAGVENNCCPFTRSGKTPVDSAA